MFFAKENFVALPDNQDKVVAADTANDIIKEHGTVFYGRFLKDGHGIDFTTERKQTDTHVLIGIGIREMMEFAPSDAYVKTPEFKQQDKDKANELYIKQLERENRQLRGGNNGVQ